MILLNKTAGKIRLGGQKLLLGPPGAERSWLRRAGSTVPEEMPTGSSDEED